MWICLCVQLAIAKNNIIKLQEENQQLRSENTLILLKTQQHLEVHLQSIHIKFPYWCFFFIYLFFNFFFNFNFLI